MSASNELTTLELEMHLDVMSRWALRLAFEAWTEDAWEAHFPEVGEFDFERILAAAEELLPGEVALEEFQKSYEWFEKRAETLTDKGET